MPHAHDGAVFGPGGDFKTSREFRCFYFQRMVADGGERAFDIFKNAVVVMENERRFAMHDDRRAADNASSVGIAHALMVAPPDARALG